MENNNFILCPLVDREIDIVDCMENTMIRDECIPAEYKIKSDWKEICESCPYRDY